MLVLAGVLLSPSPGKPKPFTDEHGRPLEGSVSEKIRVDIDGVRLGMFIESRDATRPVLLSLHGGMPDYFLTRDHPAGLEDLFTEVLWEQRGSGLSYSPDIPPETMTEEQFVSDTLEVTNYLRRRFGEEKIYLMRDAAMHSLGIGTTHDMKSVITGIFIPSLAFREYTFMEKINLWRGKARNGVGVLWDECLATDLSERVPELSIPVYFFHVIYDYTCSYTVAKAYIERLKAPLKGFYTFENSAHSPMFEEPEKTREILREDILTDANILADP